jgi:hypothetical protein
MDFKNLKKKIHELKVLRLLPNICDYQQEKHTLGYGFKKYRKSVAKPMDFYSL